MFAGMGPLARLSSFSIMFSKQLDDVMSSNSLTTFPFTRQHHWLPAAKPGLMSQYIPVEYHTRGHHESTDSAEPLMGILNPCNIENVMNNDPLIRDFVTLNKPVINYLPRCSYHLLYSPYHFCLSSQFSNCTQNDVIAQSLSWTARPQKPKTILMQHCPSNCFLKYPTFQLSAI